MKKLFMQTITAVMMMIFLAVLLSGCATKDSIKTNTHKARQISSIKNIAIQAFTCPDPAVANDVRNMIIVYLLDNYSVIIGEKADVVISGAITLHSEQVSPASSGRAAGRVKEISADIIQNGKIMDSVSVMEGGLYLSAAASLETMGHEIAEQLSRKLSKITASHP